MLYICKNKTILLVYSVFQSIKLTFTMEMEYGVLVNWAAKGNNPSESFQNAMCLPHIHKIYLLFYNTDMLFSLYPI